MKTIVAKLESLLGQYKYTITAIGVLLTAGDIFCDEGDRGSACL
jgi:hypothetical protein